MKLIRTSWYLFQTPGREEEQKGKLSNAGSIALVEGIFPYGWTTQLRFHVGLSQHVCGRGFHCWELVAASVECLVCWHKTGRRWMVKMIGLKGHDLLICALSDWDSQQRVGTLPGWGWTPSAPRHHGSSGQNSFCMCSLMWKVITSSGFWIIFFLLAGVSLTSFRRDLQGPKPLWWRLARWGRGGFD